MKVKKFNMILILAVLCLLLSSCLTTEFKKYFFTLEADGSGIGSIEFVNIVSEEDEDQNVSFSDFDELVNNYVMGTTFEEENPNFLVTNKELLESDGALNGLVEFEFSDFQEIGFYHYQRSETAPIIFYLGSLSETLLETNGEYLGNDKDLPLIIWPPGTTEFSFKTVVKEDMSDAHGLLDLYKLWVETNK